MITHASVLTVSSYANRTSPVVRGKFILENILNSAPPPPPGDVPTLAEKDIGVSKSMREQLEAHRSQPVCASCHVRMDPLGFGLENFDAVGRGAKRWASFPSMPAVHSQMAAPSPARWSWPRSSKPIGRISPSVSATSCSPTLSVAASRRRIEAFPFQLFLRLSRLYQLVFVRLVPLCLCLWFFFPCLLGCLTSGM